MFKRLCIVTAVTSALASPVWADDYALGLVNPVKSATTSYPGSQGILWDTYTFEIASGSTVKVDFQGYPDTGTFLPPLDFMLRAVDWSQTFDPWGAFDFGPDFGSTGFGSHTVSGLSTGVLYAVSVYGGGVMPPGSAGSYDLTLSIPTAPVPEPETYAMLMAGLGLLGFVARRRKPGKPA